MKALAQHYIPIEHNIKLSKEERTSAVVEWYTKAHNDMLAEDITPSKLESIVTDCWGKFEIHLREKCCDFFLISKVHEIPITVLSAGLRNVIELILAKEGFLDRPADFADDEGDEPIMVVSNRMHFENGKHVGFSDPIIHAMNKRDALSEFLVQSRTRSSRPNALLMGDLIADVDFVHSVPNLHEYIAIGFLADSATFSEELVEKYLAHFDIVILGGSASMDVPLEFVKALTENI